MHTFTHVFNLSKKYMFRILLCFIFKFIFYTLSFYIFEMGTNMLNWVHYTSKLFRECLSLREPPRVCTTENLHHYFKITKTQRSVWVCLVFHKNAHEIIQTYSFSLHFLHLFDRPINDKLVDEHICPRSANGSISIACQLRSIVQ